MASLADELEILVEFVPTSTDDVQLWDQRAQRLIDKHLLGAQGLSQFVPHFLWHYLSDADIRFKDKDHSEIHNKRIRALLAHLKLGKIPTDEELSTGG